MRVELGQLPRQVPTKRPWPDKSRHQGQNRAVLTGEDDSQAQHQDCARQKTTQPHWGFISKKPCRGFDANQRVIFGILVCIDRIVE